MQIPYTIQPLTEKSQPNFNNTLICKTLTVPFSTPFGIYFLYKQEIENRLLQRHQNK